MMKSRTRGTGRALTWLVAAAMLLSAAGCACCRPKSKGTDNNKVALATEAGTSKATVAHCVYLWLKDPGDADGRRRIVEAAHTFRDIPGVVDVYAGPAIPSDNKAVESTYDVGLIVLFTDRESLEAYGPHPIHDRAAKEVILPIIDKVLSYDFTVE